MPAKPLMRMVMAAAPPFRAIVFSDPSLERVRACGVLVVFDDPGDGAALSAALPDAEVLITSSAGIRVTQAGQAMDLPVAEVSLAFTPAMLRRIHRFDRAPPGSWSAAAGGPLRYEVTPAAPTRMG
jgi:hypothetical protein